MLGKALTTSWRATQARIYPVMLTKRILILSCCSLATCCTCRVVSAVMLLLCGSHIGVIPLLVKICCALDQV